MKSLNGTAAGGNRDDGRETETDTETRGSMPADTNRRGSTIVGVLAALVFIGIVVAAMVKNTGAQSAASLGYGSAMTMQSTVNSGIVATEGFFANNPTDGIKFINDIKEGAEMFLLNTDEKNKRPLSSNQFFSSKRSGAIKNNLTTSGGNIKTGFEVVAGKNAKGKGLRSARVFYQFGNLMEESTEGGPMGTNAVFSAGPINNQDAGIAVKGGGATFLGDVSFQNKPSSFEEEAYFGGVTKFPGQPVAFTQNAWFMNVAVFQGTATFKSDVYFNNTSEFAQTSEFKQLSYFMGAATFKGAATFTDLARFANNAEFSTSATFNYDAYFGMEAYFQGGSVTFNGRVGFDGTIKTNLTMKSPNDRDVYMNATFVTGYGGKLQGINIPSQEVTFSEKPSATDKARFINITHHNDGKASTGMTAVAKLAGITSNATKMKPPTPPTVEKRTDPELSTAPIYKASTLQGGSVVIHNASAVMTANNGNIFDFTTLYNAYQTFKNKPETLYKGYMVIEVNSDITFSSEPTVPFDANIIYIIKDGITFNAANKFYKSSENSNASTLIYVGAGNATLEQFGTSGIFRGFIYIDKENTAKNSLSFPSTGSIIGAVHNFATKFPMGWNTGGSGSMSITFSKEVISSFATLYPCKENCGSGGSGGNGGNVVFQNGKNSIEVKPLGFYFY